LKAALTAPAQPDSTGSAPAPSANAPRANPPLAEGPKSAAAAKPPNTFSLLIRAEETSWVSITLDGKPVAQETLIAPAHTSIRAAGEVVVKAGNAAGISFQLNGEDIPAQGNEGEVKTYVFDAAGFRVLPQTQSPAAIR
jgi:cytoskeleton protein RodZ